MKLNTHAHIKQLITPATHSQMQMTQSLHPKSSTRTQKYPLTYPQLLSPFSHVKHSRLKALT